jgi:hypothetical protein
MEHAKQEIRNTYNILLDKPEERNHLGDIGLDGSKE